MEEWAAAGDAEGGRPDTFVTGPAAIRHLDIINSHEGMTRDLSPLFQCLITKSVCCLHKGEDFNPHRGYRFVIDWLEYFVLFWWYKGVHRLRLLPSPLAGAGSQVPFSGHTSFRLLGVFLDPATHTFTFCTCMERYTSLLLLMSLVLTMSTLVYITIYSSQGTKKMFCRKVWCSLSQTYERSCYKIYMPLHVSN